MGHVDHGKTSLLDAMRDADVVAGDSVRLACHLGYVYYRNMSDLRYTY